MAEKGTDKPPEKAARTGEGKRGYIQYIGLATMRGFRRTDWEAVGVNDQDEVWWTRMNGYRVDRAALTDAAYNVAIRPDRQFVLIGGDPEEGSVESHPQADNPPAMQAPQMPDPLLYGR